MRIEDYCYQLKILLFQVCQRDNTNVTFFITSVENYDSKNKTDFKTKTLEIKTPVNLLGLDLWADIVGRNIRSGM